jgi:site-specific recombinase XerD
MHLEQHRNIGQDAQNFTTLVKIFLKTKGFSEGTVSVYAGHLRVLLDLLHCSPQELTIEHIEQVGMAAKKIKKTPAAYNMFVTVVKSFLSWLAKNNYCEYYGTVLREIPRVEKQRHQINPDEYLTVVNSSLPQYKKDVFVFLCHSGLRSFEFRGLTSASVHGDFIKFIKKGGDEGVIPINKTMREILDRDPKLSFIRGKGHSWLAWLCNDIAKRTGIKKFHPHSCRHFLANSLHRKKVDLKSISMVLNHKSVAVTEAVYIEWIIEEELKGVTDVLD